MYLFSSGKIMNNVIAGLFIFGSPTISNNVISAITIYDGSPTISNNEIDRLETSICNITGYGTCTPGGKSIELTGTSADSPLITNNTIEKIYGECIAPVITDNDISGSIGSFAANKSELVISYFVADSATITNNVIGKGMALFSNSSTVSKNTVSGYTFSYSWTERWSSGMFGTDTYHEYSKDYTKYYRSSGITIEGGAYVWGNTISGCVKGIVGGTTIQGNKIYDCEIGIEGGKKVSGNLLENNTEGIVITESDTIIQSNKIDAGATGIGGHGSGTMIIENNYLCNQNTTGIYLMFTASIKNNTFSNIPTAIKAGSVHSPNINYNNFENCQKTITMIQTSENFDATNNWWGTTDTQVIEAAIHDNKDTAELGTVVFNPILTEPNPEATPLENPEIPEIPAWLVLPLFLVATLVVAFLRRRVIRRNLIT
jgi:hypothetical protein